MKESEEAATEAEAKGYRCFRLKYERGIVKLKLFKCITKIAVSCAIGRIDTRIYHGMNLTEAVKGLCRRIVCQCNCITYTGLANSLNRCGNVTYLTGRKRLCLLKTEGLHCTNLNNVKLCALCHKSNLVTCTKSTVKNTNIYHNAKVWVVMGVEDQCLKRLVTITLRCGNICHNLLKNILDIKAVLCRNGRTIIGRNTDNILNFTSCTHNISGGKVDLIDNRKNLKVVVNGEVCVCKSLRLNTLGCVNYKECALACLERTGNLIAKVNVTGSINKIIDVFFPILCCIGQSDSTSLDCDTTLTFKVHVVKKLLLHITALNSSGFLKNSVGQCGFTVVNMRYNGEISNMLLFICHCLCPEA